MKRSEINSKLKDAAAFFEQMSFKLPPWAYWNQDQWRDQISTTKEIRENALGWDLTDFGSGNFLEKGLLLFTIRNGKLGSKTYPKPYAEKIMIVEEGQITPMHYHWNKMEDIINRGGGNLQIELFKANDKDELSDLEFFVKIDGVEHRLKPGSIVTLKPGESICLMPGLFHKFWGEVGKGRVLVGEVSMVNDDANDNNFQEKCGRFPDIEEDEAFLFPLCTEYAKFA